MGTSVPDDPRWSADAPPGEQQLWRWVVEQLDDRIRVLPQVLLTVPDRGRPQEAEIDLVLLDPEHGVTVVEVKGGRMHYDGAGRWLTGVVEVLPRADAVVVEVERGERSGIAGGVLSFQVGEWLIARLADICLADGHTTSSAGSLPMAASRRCHSGSPHFMADRRQVIT